MSKSSVRTGCASSCDSGLIGPSLAHHLRHAVALCLAHQQAAFRAPPEHVLGAARPLFVDEVAQLAFGQPRAVFLAEAPVADHLVRARAVPAEDRALCLRRHLPMSPEVPVAPRLARLLAEIT